MDSLSTPVVDFLSHSCCIWFNLRDLARRNDILPTLETTRGRTKRGREHTYILFVKFPNMDPVQFSSVAQSCPTLCDPMNHSMPGLPVHHQLPESTQTHVHRVSDAIQPSHPLSFSSCSQSFPALGSFQMSQLFASGGQSIGVSASASVLPMNTQGWSPLGWTGSISLQSKGLLRVFSNTTVQKTWIKNLLCMRTLPTQVCSVLTHKWLRVSKKVTSSTLTVPVKFNHWEVHTKPPLWLL